MQKQVFYKHVHAFLGRGLTVTHIAGLCKSTDKHHTATCRAFIFPLDYDGMVSFILVTDRKPSLFKTSFSINKRKSEFRAQHAGPARGEATAKEGELSNMNENEQC